MKLFGFWGLFDPKVFMNDFLANSQYTIAHVAYKSLNSPLFHILTMVFCHLHQMYKPSLWQREQLPLHYFSVT